MRCTDERSNPACHDGTGDGIGGSVDGDGAGHAGRTGRVTLLGAGPGDPDLLTVRAARVLSQARLVLYDHLVSEAVLDLLPHGAQRLYVGKESARHAMAQNEICSLMVRLARQGRDLVRLKGGDGFIFGRGGEEAQALAAADIHFEVIPGITAAQGAGASVGIPLTHRDHADLLVYATGHLREGSEQSLDWQQLARPHQTVVIYMGMGQIDRICRELIAHGLPPTQPAAIVEQACLPAERCIDGTLETLPALAREHDVRPPALIFIGDVVRVRAQLAPWLRKPVARAAVARRRATAA